MGQINYHDDDDTIISKEEFEDKYKHFKKEVEDSYNKIASELINRINSITTSDMEKLWMLYDYLTSDNMTYDLQGTTQDGRLATHEGYKVKGYKTWKIKQGTKYPALLNNSGVCITYSLAFEDLANRLGIPCKVITGYTGMEHAWNVVLINNEIKQIDVAYAIMNRKINRKEDYFLKDYFMGRTTNESIDTLTNELRNQYIKMHPQIKIISRSDEPTIRIISRTANNEVEPRITIHKK